MDFLNWKTKVCSDWLEGRCVKDAAHCFDSHNATPCKRKLLVHLSKFNYLPKKCRSIQEGNECEDGVFCRFAHNKYEILLHPSRFRTNFCTSSGKDCGPLCSYAHSEEEIRIPMYEPVMPKSVEILSLAHQELYVNFYKTRKCEGFPFACECRGFDYHNPNEKRRSPFSFKYRAKMCLKPNCTESRCGFAHHTWEIMYHPMNYKKVMCKRFTETGNCKLGEDCSHAHSEDEIKQSYLIIC